MNAIIMANSDVQPEIKPEDSKETAVSLDEETQQEPQPGQQPFIPNVTLPNPLLNPMD